MVLIDSKDVIDSSNVTTITLRDINLERLYRALFLYFEQYSRYQFTILRKHKFYELNFKGWRGS